MATQTDHVRLDAEHAARLEIAKVLERYKRRIYADAKAAIGSAIANSAPGAVLEGTQIGEDAVQTVLATYLGAGEATPAIEAGTTTSSA